MQQQSQQPPQLKQMQHPQQQPNPHQISSVHYQTMGPQKPNPIYDQHHLYQQQQQQQAQMGHPQPDISTTALQQTLYHQQQIQNHYSIHPTARSPPNSLAGVRPPTAQQMQQMQQQPLNQNIYTSGATSIMSGAATLRRPPSNHHQNPQMQMPPHAMEQIPNSNFIDNSMFERDKQIYKCSTLRQGGKFDPRNFGNIRMPPVGPNDYTMNGNPQNAQKPSILNCPLPEIPKEFANGDPNPMEPKYNGNNMANQPTMTR